MPPPPPRPPAALARLLGPALALALAVALPLAAGCAPPREDDLYGMILDVRSEQAWTADPALRSRLGVLLSESCDHLGLDPSMLYGMTLRVDDGAIACGDTAAARGCTWREAGIVSVSTLAWISTQPPVPCVEDTPIPHELLHVRIGDPGHLDPRWRSAEYWEPLWRRVTRPDCSGARPEAMW